MQPRKASRQNQRRRAPQRKRAPSNKTLNNKIKKINKTIELKKGDGYLAPGVIPLAGTQLSTFVSNIVQGTGEGESRIGTQISPTSIQFKCNFLSNTNILTQQRVRMMVVWDRQSNSAAIPLSGAGTTSLLDTTIITDPLLAPLNYDAIERYTVLYDKMIVLNPNTFLTATTLVPIGKQIKKKIKLSRIVKYNGAGPQIPFTNNLALCWFASNNGGSAALLPTVECGARLYYKDA